VEASSGPDIPHNSYAHSLAGMSVQFILATGVDVGIGLRAMRLTYPGVECRRRGWYKSTIEHP